VVGGAYHGVAGRGLTGGGGESDSRGLPRRQTTPEGLVAETGEGIGLCPSRL